MRFFFFGSLMDADVRTAVLGRAVPERQCRQARIEGFRRVQVTGRSFPVLVPLAGASTDGMLVDGLNRNDAARLRYFEGDEYRLARRMVFLSDGTPCQAHIFLAATGLRPSRLDWDFAAWERSAKRHFLQVAKRRMGQYRATQQ